MTSILYKNWSICNILVTNNLLFDLSGFIIYLLHITILLIICFLTILALRIFIAKKENDDKGEHFKNIMLGVGAACIPLIGYYYTNIEKEKTLAVDYITLGIKILEENPDENSEAKREWAVDLINNYSELEISPKLKEQLVHSSTLITPGKYGEQEKWQVSNLNVNTYKNGYPIIQARNPIEWKELNNHKIGCYCYYAFDSAKYHKYGKLYNYYAIEDPNGIVPDSLRIIDNDRVKKLVYEYGYPKIVRLDTVKWLKFLNGGNINIKMRDVLGGYIDSNGKEHNVGEEGRWWTVSPAWGSRTKYYYFSIKKDSLTWNPIQKNQGYYIRCFVERMHEPDTSQIVKFSEECKAILKRYPLYYNQKINSQTVNQQR